MLNDKIFISPYNKGSTSNSICNLSFSLHRQTSVLARRETSKTGSPFILNKHSPISFPSATGRRGVQLLTRYCAFVSLAHLRKNRMEGWHMARRSANSSNCAVGTFCRARTAQTKPALLDLCWLQPGPGWECLLPAPHTEPGAAAALLAVAKKVYSDRSARQRSLVLARCERCGFSSLVRPQLIENC